MMKKGIEILLVGLMMMAAVSCTEEFIIDVEEGDRMIGVEAYLSDEMKQHEVILSYTADFYNMDEISMISGATVFVTDGVDTIPYIEDQDNKGHYLTDVVAGKKNTVYRLCINVTDADGEVTQLWSECLIPNNVECVDSLVIKPFNGGNDSMQATAADPTAMTTPFRRSFSAIRLNGCILISKAFPTPTSSTCPLFTRTTPLSTTR